MAVDMMRYAPLGYDTLKELKLLSYLIAWFHNVLSSLPGFITSNLPGNPAEITVTYSAIMFPVFMFGLTVVAFFLLTRKIFEGVLIERDRNIVALISSFFLSVLPVLLPRTIAGIPEKESASFFFIFMAFYFFLSAWRTKKMNYLVICSLLAGISTGTISLIWGGYQYIPLVLAASVGVAFILGQVDKNKIIVFGIWIITTRLIMAIFSSRYSLDNLVLSLSIQFTLAIFIILIFHKIIFKTNLHKKIYRSSFRKIPKEIFSGIAAFVFMIVGSALVFGVDFISNNVNGIISNLVKPATSRLIQTVAENRQPYFGEWSNTFGPIIQGFPVFFWLFFIGSVYIFYKMVSSFRLKERIIMTGSYLFFLIAIVFSRYSPSSMFNGENNTSLIFYVLGFIILIGVNGYYYIKYYFNEERKYKLLKINFGLVFLLAFFVLGVVSARGAVRLIMMLAPPTSIVISYFVVSLIKETTKVEDEFKKLILWIFVAITIVLVISAGWQFYQASTNQAKHYVPSGYTQQWQEAMSWVRENTQENAVFGHWWDYGYWVQSIGERATVLDGSNAISYWNHLMGRHVLTSPNEISALEFLYAHNTTHYLIDSTEIGKYGAYSKIGSDTNGDRDNFIPTFFRDERQIQETNEGLVYVYPTGIPLYEDIIWEDNNLLRENTGIGAILVEDIGGSLQQPQAVFVKWSGEQITIPLKYLYANGELMEFENGIEAGVFLFDILLEEKGQIGVNLNSAGFYLSPRVVNSLMVRKYLFGEEGNFKLAHSEDNLVTSSLKSQGMPIREFIYFQGNFHGPIKIWEIEYPEDIKFKEEYLSIEYPEELRLA
jgi:asparagine N-glycosylation enzyme membrane subunit Stt3